MSEKLKLYKVDITINTDAYVLAADEQDAKYIAEENKDDIIQDLDCGASYHAAEITHRTSRITSGWINAIPYQPADSDDDRACGDLLEAMKDDEAGRPLTREELEAKGQASLPEVNA